MTIEVSRSTHKERHWPVWVGSMDDLRKLSASLDDLGEIRRDKLLAAIDDKIHRELDEAEKNNSEVESDEGDSSVPASLSLTFYRERIESDGESDRKRIRKNYQVTATAIDGDDTTTGSVDTVLDEVDRRTVNSVEFTIGKYDDQISVHMARTGFKRGATLKVSSPDRGWAKHAFAQLTEEIDKGVPKYSWMSQGYGSRIARLVSACLITLAVVLIVLPAVPRPDRSAVWIAGAFAACWTFILLSAFGDGLSYWIAPPFELISQDAQSTGRRRIGSLIGLLGAVIIGVVVNRIYS